MDRLRNRVEFGVIRPSHSEGATAAAEAAGVFWERSFECVDPYCHGGGHELEDFCVCSS